MINFAALKQKTIYHEPFAYAVFNHLLTLNDAKELASSLPQNNVNRIIRKTGSDKTYSNITTVLLELGSTQYNDRKNLTSKWITFLDQLTSYEYRTALAKIFGEELQDCHL